MADANVVQPSFSSGEVSPDLYGRVDLAKFHVGAATMRNFFVNYKGGASTRPGTQYIGSVGAQNVRLRRFVFSATQTYILVFVGNGVLQFIANPGTAAYPNSSNSGFILSGGSPYSISTPYLAADLPYLKFSQSADIMNITCSNFAHPRMILSRLSDTNWTLTQPLTGSSLPAPSGLGLSITSPPSGSTDPATTTYLYSVTAVGSDGEESVASDFDYVTGLDMTATLGSVSASWNPVAGAQYYNVYRAIATSGGTIPSYGQQLGFVGYAYGPSFVESNITPDFTRSPPLHTDPFSPSQMTGYTITNPGSGYDVEATQINGPPNTIILPIFDNNTVGGTGAIVGLYILNAGENVTAGAPITATSDSGSGFAATATVGPANQNPGVSAYFQQRLMLASTAANPVTIWGSKNGYYNNFDKSNPIVDNDSLEFTLAVQQVNSIEWMVTMPGGLVLFTDAGVQQLTGGSSTATNPLAVTPSSAVVVPQSYYGSNNVCEPIVINYDILYAQSEGSVIRDLTYNFFVNIYTGTDITLLSSHLFYPHQIIDWAYQDVPFKVIWIIRDDGALLSLTYLKEQDVTGFARHDSQGGIFESVAVIREGTMDAVYFVVNRGGSRYIERLTDRNYVGGVETAWCLDSALSYSGAPTTVVSGLDHLDGLYVMALADGIPQGPFGVSSGTITLPIAASNIVVGLQIEAQLQTLYLDVGEAGGSIQGKRKKIAAMSTRVKETAGLKIGTTFSTLTPFRPGISSTDPAAWPAPPGLVTGDMRLIMDPAYQVAGSVCIQQDDPLPATVLAVIPEISVGDGQR